MLQTQVFTLYPDTFPGPLAKGLYGKAMSKKLWSLNIINIRDAATDKHKTVDDIPYGGGAGMLLKPDVLANSIDQNVNKGERILYLSPKGKVFNQKLAQDLSLEKSFSLICGHFEGVDERVLSTRNIEEVSLGDYVLSGGETAALVVLDSVLRLLPGVLGNDKSASEETFENGLLEYPQYTKPQIWEKKSVPEVLLSGDHAKIKHASEDQIWGKNIRKIKLLNIKMITIEEINQHNVKKILSEKKIPKFFPGDVVKVGVRITEGKKERIQYFEGVCIAKKNRDLNSSFTVRKISFGEGVERTFPLYGTVIDSIKIIRSGKVRRAKLYYLRDRTGKSARIAEKIRKKIGIDIEVKPETVTEENLAPVDDKTKLESNKESTNPNIVKNDEDSNMDIKKDPSVAETNTEKKLENLQEKK